MCLSVLRALIALISILFCLRASAVWTSTEVSADGNYDITLANQRLWDGFTSSAVGRIIENYCPQAGCTNPTTTVINLNNQQSWISVSNRQPGFYTYTASVSGTYLSGTNGGTVDDPVNVPGVTVLPRTMGTAAALDLRNFEIYYGDFNGDGQIGDVYVYDRGPFVLLFGDVSIPMFVGGSNSFVYYQNGSKYQQPVSINLPRSTVYAGVKAVQDQDFWVKDINVDGSLDLFIRGGAKGTSSLLALGRPTGFPVLAAVYDKNGNNLFAWGGKALTFDASDRDEKIDFVNYNGDAKLELYRPGNGVFADQYFNPSISGTYLLLSYFGPNYDTAPKFKPSQVVGVTNVSMRVSEQGAATISMPISLPQGIAGVAPKVSISYSSHGGVGLLGTGWSIGGYSSINICRNTLLQDAGAKPLEFSLSPTLCLDGQRLVQEQNSNYLSTEVDSFIRVSNQGYGNDPYYVVEGKDGTIKYYGSTANSKLKLLDGVSGFHTWALTKECDSAGNCIEYNYINDASTPGDFLLSDISYAIPKGKTSSDAMAKVVFEYDKDRPDSSIAYLAGRQLSNTKRVAAISVFNAPAPGQLQLLKRYALGYERVADLSTVAPSLLQGVQECSYALGSEVCLAPTKFNWTPKPTNINIENIYAPSWDEKVVRHEDSFISDIVPMDLNGDGLNDLVWIEGDLEYGGDYNMVLRGKVYDPQTKSFVIGAFSKDGVPVSSDPFLAIADSSYGAQWGTEQINPKEKAELRPVDFNADGHMDLGIFWRDTDTLSIFVSEPMGDGRWALNLNSPAVNSKFNDNSLFADVDSDGLMDIVEPGSMTTDKPAGVYLLKKSASVTDIARPYAYGGRNSAVTSAIPLRVITTQNSPSAQTTYTHTPTKSLLPAGDLNNDGAADFILIDRVVTDYSTKLQYSYKNGCVEKQENYYAILNSKNGLEYTQYAYLGYRKIATDCSGLDPNPESLAGVQALDINGDGLSDLVMADGGNLHLLINTGVGFNGIDTSGVLLPSSKIASYSNDKELKAASVQFFDADSDGYMDLVSRTKIQTVSNGVEVKLTYRSWNPKTLQFEVKEKAKVLISGLWIKDDAQRTMFVDFSGDGVADLLRTDGSHLKYNQGTGTNNFGRLITGIENGLGAKTDITYEQLSRSNHYNSLWETFTEVDKTGFYFVDKAKAKDNFYNTLNKTVAPAGDKPLITTNVPTLEYTAPLFLVSKVSGDMPTATSGSTTVAGTTSGIEYFYAHARVQPGGRGFLGFESVVTKDIQTGIKTETRYRQDWPYVGFPSLTTTMAPNGQLISLKSNSYTLAGKYGEKVWEDTVTEASPTFGSWQFGPLKPYIKQSKEISFVTKSTANSIGEFGDITGVAGATTINCILPFACSKPATSAAAPQPGGTTQVVQQVVTTEQKYDNYGNPYSIKVTASGGEGGDAYTHVTTTESDFDSDNNPSTQDTGPSLKLAGDKRTTMNYRRLGRLTYTKSTSTVTRPGFAATELTTKEAGFTYYADGDSKGMLQTETGFSKPGAAFGAGLGKEFEFRKNYYYDTFGNTIKTTIEAHKLTYDFAGNIAGSPSIESRSTESQYDTNGRYLEAGLQDFGADYFGVGKSKITINKVLARDVFGSPIQIKSVDDSNHNLITTIQTDALGRPIKSSDTTGAGSETRFVDCSKSTCPIKTAVWLTQVVGKDGAITETYTDKLLRTVGKGSSDIKGEGKMNLVEIQYDSLGHVKRQSLPYGTGQTPDAKGWTSNVYDILGRTVATVVPDSAGSPSTTSIDYQGLLTSVTENGRTRSELKTPMGELREVTDPLGGKLKYGYNAKGQLETITKVPAPLDTQSSNVVTSFTYDQIGRKLSMNDPDKGEWSYKYNAYGDLMWQKDGKGQVTTQSYDAFGRLERRTTYTAAGAVADHTRWYFDGKTHLNAAANVLAVGKISAVVLAGANSANDELCTPSTAQHCTLTTFDGFGRADGVAHAYYYKGSLVGSYSEGTTFDSLGRVQYQYDALNGNVRDTSSAAVWNKTSGTETLYGAAGHAVGVRDLRSNKTVYQVFDQNASGAVTGAYVGAVTVKNTYNPYTGLLEGQQADVSGIRSVQKTAYEWDQFGNLKNRYNSTNSPLGQMDLKEAFCYDTLNRLTHTARGTLTPDCASTMSSSNSTNVMVYDSFGNIRGKKDVGTSYNYMAPVFNDAGVEVRKLPHAVASIGSTTYQYDLNGNNTSTKTGTSFDRTIKYTVFDKPFEIYKASGNALTSLAYDAGRNLIYQEDGKQGLSPTVKTVTMGNVQKIIKGNEVIWKRYLGGVALFEETTDLNGVLVAGKSTSESYFFKDHVGSLDVITDYNGNIIENLSFDAWGQRRDVQSWAGYTTQQLLDKLAVITSANPRAMGYGYNNLASLKRTTKGFTGHTMLDDTGLIHMGGRIYDPKLARFMQADPFVQAGTNTQSFNRYGYTYSNPLNATDPSGYLSSSFRREFRQAFATVAAIVATIYCTEACAWQVYAMIAAAGAAMNGADGKGILIAAAVGGALAAIGGSKGLGDFERFMTAGVVGGLGASLQGGNFANGFISAGVGTLGLGPQGAGPGDVLARAGIAAVIGGSVSELNGGKFKNGAATAAFVSLTTDVGVTIKAIRDERVLQKYLDHFLDGTREDAENKIMQTADAAKKLLQERLAALKSPTGDAINLGEVYGAHGAELTGKMIGMIEKAIITIDQIPIENILPASACVIRACAKHINDPDAKMWVIQGNGRPDMMYYKAEALRASQFTRYFIHEISHMAFGASDANQTYGWAEVAKWRDTDNRVLIGTQNQGPHADAFSYYITGIRQ